MLERSQSSDEPPAELVRRLTSLQLCRPADFRRARAGVRRLCYDLPAFDSVWIDALVQLGKLTPFQARQIEAGFEDRLLIGSFVVIDELGQGPHGTTLLAGSGRQDRIVLKRVNGAIEAIPECRQRLTQVVERSQGWSHPNLVIPHALLTVDGKPLVTVSRWVHGLTLGELLVRRGRFPAPIVLEIARQLASGLAALHSRTLVHGDLQMSNVRMTSGGLIVLVDGGIRPAVCPELTIHESLSLDAYDGIAPELIGTGIAANAASEIYAVGCLLWQLLTGRPPPDSMADPLMKLAAHQTRRIADVRSLAPDTPAILAEAIFAMTSSDVNERPRSFDALLQRWGRPGLASRSRLKRYRKKFDGAVPHFIKRGEPATDSRWAWTAVMLFVAAGMSLTFADKGVRNQLLTISQRVTDAIQAHRAESAASQTLPDAGPMVAAESPGRESTVPDLLPLPDPSADGEIVLSRKGPYSVAKVARAGRLTIRGEPGISPIIQIGSEPLRLAGTVLTLQNLTVVCDKPSGQLPPAMLLVTAQELVIQGCQFERTIPDAVRTDAVGRNSAIVAWQPLPAVPVDPDTWRVAISESSFRVHGAAFWGSEIPALVTMTNCLKLGDGPCFAFAPKSRPHPSTLNLNKITLRETGPLLRLAGNFAEQADAPTIKFTTRDCVFALGSTSAGLIELESPRPRSDAARSVKMGGHGYVVPPGLKLMAVVDAASPARMTAREVPDADEQFDGIQVSELQFAGPAQGPPSNSVLESLTAPRSAGDVNPGIDTTLWRKTRPE